MAGLTITTSCEFHELPTGATELKYKLAAVLPPNAAARRPIAIALLVDVSGSMTDAWHIVKRAVQWLVNRSGLDSRDLISLILFNNYVMVDLPLQPLTAQAAQQLLRQLEECEPDGGTNICGAIDAAMQELAKAPADCPQLIILATDGESNAGGGPYEMVSALLGLAAAPPPPAGEWMPSLPPAWLRTTASSYSTRLSPTLSAFGTQLSDSDSDVEPPTAAPPAPAARTIVCAPRAHPAGSLTAARSLLQSQKSHAPVDIFTLGIGTRCNPELLALLAEVGSGQPLFIREGFTDVEMQAGLAVPIVQATSIELVSPTVEITPAAGFCLSARRGGRTTTGDLLPPHMLACALPHLRAGSTKSLLVTVTASRQIVPSEVLGEITLAGVRAQLVAPAVESDAPTVDGGVLWLELHDALLGRIAVAVAAGEGLRTALREIAREFEAHPTRALPEAAPFAAMLAQMLETATDAPAPARLGPSLTALSAARTGSDQVAPTAFGLRATFTATQSEQ